MWRRKTRPAPEPFDSAQGKPPAARMEVAATAEVVLSPDPRVAGMDGFDWVAGASPQLALSHPVLVRALRQLGWIRECRVRRLRSMLSAWRGGDRVWVQCLDTDAVRARAVARTVAAAYAEWTRERAEETIRLAARRAARELEVWEEERRALALEIAQRLGAAGAAREVAALSERYNQLRARVEALKARVPALRDAFYAAAGTVDVARQESLERARL